ncbi:hypothetical protein [Flavicella sp.]|uniref:hypothetical protein n=1 Tax=Flavicella sp. TaxID=2957742 RepID=UPI00301B29B9
MKTFLFILFLFSTTLIVSGQVSGTTLSGVVQSDILFVPDIHVLNLSSNFGTISNLNGQFEIEVKLNDTLLISGIKYIEKIIVIRAEIMNSSYIPIKLEVKVNELTEVVISNGLSGNLWSDISNMKKAKSKYTFSSEVLNFSTAGVNPLTVDDEWARRKTSDNSSLGGPAGGDADLMLLGGYVLAPLIKEIGKIGKVNRKIKRNEEKLSLQATNALSKIRQDFGDDLFLQIGIPKEKINTFIEFCSSKKIGEYFIKDDKLKIIEVFLEEYDEFKRIYNF